MLKNKAKKERKRRKEKDREINKRIRCWALN